MNAILYYVDNFHYYHINYKYLLKIEIDMHNNITILLSIQLFKQKYGFILRYKNNLVCRKHLKLKIKYL